MSIHTKLKELFDGEYYSNKYDREGIPAAHDLHIPVFAKEFQCQGHAFDLEKQILDKISAPFGDEGTLSTLILGDSGSGKSWLAHKLTKFLFETLDLRLKIPLYIPLRAVEEASCERSSDCEEGKTYQYTSICFNCRKPNNILFAYLQLHCTNLDMEQIDRMYRAVQKFELILFLDGYDELQDKVNLWSVNKWDLDRYRVRTFVFGRSSSFLNLDLKNLFIFCKGGKRREAIQYVITPLEDKLVAKYLQRVPLFLKDIELDNCVSGINDPWIMTKRAIVKLKIQPVQANGEVVRDWESSELGSSEYYYWFYIMLPELQGLSRNVYLLTIICQMLPILVEQKRREISDPDEFVTALKQICATEVSIYDEFTKAWVVYQVNKFRESGDPLSKIYDVLRFYMFAYAQNLAIHCISSNKGALFDGSMGVGLTEFWNLWVPLDPYDLKDPKEPEFKRDFALEQELFPRDDKDGDEGRLKNLRFLRDASLLRYDKGSKTFEFFHLSLLEYFASRDIFVNLRAHLNFYINYDRGDESYFIINRSNISHSKFHGILTMIVDKVQQNEGFQKILLESIKKSAEIPGIEQMASNAMTILNFCGFNFSGNDIDFRNIQVPYANLSRSICGNSDFTGANFEGANLSEGWFQNCLFQGANFTNCHFGEHCHTKLKPETRVFDMLFYHTAAAYYVVICCGDPRNECKVLFCIAIKYSTDFEFIEANKFFKLTEHDWEDTTHLIRKGDNLYLLLFTKTQLNNKRSVVVPKTLYELNLTSVNFDFVNTFDINFNISELDISTPKNVQKRYIVLENSPRFATKIEFFKRCLQPSHGSALDINICISRLSWFPVGPIQLLYCILFEVSNKSVDLCKSVDFSLTFGCVQDIAVLQKGVPILAEGEVNSFEIWWDLCDLQPETHRSLLKGIVFDGKALLSVRLPMWMEPEDDDRNVYFFDLQKSIQKPHIKCTKLSKHSTQWRLVYSERNVAIWQEDEEVLKFKINTLHPSFEYKFSKELDYVAHRRHGYIDIINTVSGNLEKIVSSDISTPFLFATTLDSKTYFLYVYVNRLHFIQLSSYSSELAFGLDARVRKPTGSKFAAFDGLRHSGNIASPNTGDTDVMWVVDEAMVTRSEYTICKAHYNRDRMDYKLIAFAPDGKEVAIFGIPHENRFKFESLHFLRRQYRIVVETLATFSVYKLEEPDKPNSGQGMLSHYALELVELFSTPINYSVTTELGWLIVSATPNGSCMVSQNFEKEPESVFYLNVNANCCTELKIYYGKKVSSNKNVTEEEIRCCYYYCKDIFTGNVDLVQQRFYATHVIKIMLAKFYSIRTYDPIRFVQLSPELHWLSMLTSEGEILIVDSDSLKLMFSFQGFNKAVEFYVDKISDAISRIITWTRYGHVTWLKINAKSLRQCFDSNDLDALEKFREWKVEKSDLCSTTFSLFRTDIGDLRGIDQNKLNFLKCYKPRGEPSDEVYVPFCSLFEPVTDSLESMLSPIGQGLGGSVDLTEKWAVTVIAKKSKILQKAIVDWHSGLVLEGIHYNRHFVIRAHLVLKEGVGSVVIVKGNSETHKVHVWSLGAGNKSGYLEIVNNYVASQYEVTKEDGLNLLENIWGDRSKKWSYSLWKNNCNTWCKQKLGLIGCTFPKRKRFQKFPDLSKDFFEKHNLKNQLEFTGKH